MKLIIILLLFPLISLSQIKVSGYFDAGYINETVTVSGKQSRQKYLKDNAMYSDIHVSVRLKRFEIKQSMMNVFEYYEGSSFDPIYIKYTTSGMYNYKRMSLGIEHMCLHPIIASYRYDMSNQLKGSCDKIFVRVRFGEN